MGEQYTLIQESKDRLTDTLDILELNCDLARKGISSARDAFKRVFPHFFQRMFNPKFLPSLPIASSRGMTQLWLIVKPA
jgi:hypothetical protein